VPKLSPIKRIKLIKNFRKLGFDGPFAGSNHEFMTKGALRVRIPNKHKSDIGRNLLIELLKQAGIDKSEWESL